jgi:hypothetical protein
MLIQGTGPYNAVDRPNFERGMQTTTYCGNDPESWVRGSATLDTDSGLISIIINLETDSVEAGPKGIVTVQVKDAAGNILATATSGEVGRGGKKPGTFASSTFHSTTTIPIAQSRQAASLYITAQCTGSKDGLFGVNLEDLLHAFQIIVAVIGGSESGGN